jgi:hypothetical protein
MSKFARCGSTSPLGKLTAEFPKFKAHEETFEEANRLAREAGMPLSEWLRNLVMIRVHGIDMVVRMHQERLSVVAGMGEVKGELNGSEQTGT